MSDSFWGSNKSRTQSPQALRPAVGRQERLRGTGILSKFFDWLLRNGLQLFYHRNPLVKKIPVSHCLRWPKSLRTLRTRLMANWNFITAGFLR